MGLTRGEREALESWNARSVVDLIQKRNAILLMDPKRQSYTRDPAFAQQIADGVAREGSSTGVLTGASLLWFQEETELQVHISADAVASLEFAIRHRLLHGNPMMLLGDPRRSTLPDGRVVEHTQTALVLLAEEGPSQVEERNGMKAAVLRLVDRPMHELLETLSTSPGAYALPGLPGVRFVVATNERFADPRYPW